MVCLPLSRLLFCPPVIQRRWSMPLTPSLRTPELDLRGPYDHATHASKAISIIDTTVGQSQRRSVNQR